MQVLIVTILQIKPHQVSLWNLNFPGWGVWQFPAVRVRSSTRRQWQCGVSWSPAARRRESSSSPKVTGAWSPRAGGVAQNYVTRITKLSCEVNIIATVQHKFFCHQLPDPGDGGLLLPPENVLHAQLLPNGELRRVPVPVPVLPSQD